MSDLGSLGRVMIFLGIVLLVFGVILIFGGKYFHFGKLPGDIFVQKKNYSFYFPIATSLILSILLSIIINLIGKK